MKDKDFLVGVREKFERAVETEDDNRRRALEDVKFGRDGEQWDENLKKDRELDGDPCLTKNRMPSFVRQVVNAARQNRPAITVIPADSGADKDTAEIISGLIRNIEVSSDADIAYDTAIESAVWGGFGYFGINTAFTNDDTFDQDIIFERKPDAFAIYGDPESESADGSDWNCAFEVTKLHKDKFAEEYKGSDPVDFDALGYTGLPSPWMDGEYVMVARYWERKEVEGQIIAVVDIEGNQMVMDLAEFRKREAELKQLGLVAAGKPRTVRRKKVTLYILSGAEVLDTVEWPGKYIPIVPVYGEEYFIEGERKLKGMIHDAVGAQQEHNFWSSAGAATIARSPRVPFIGEEGAFDVDVEKWDNINSRTIPFATYKKGSPMPVRQFPPTVSAGELQQAQQAVEDMKAIIGLYDPSLGAQANETSGVAIRQRQRQGDIGTFHFIDNLTRSIRHAGRILIDLIPKVYSTERVIRVLGQDMEPEAVQVAPGAPPQAQQMAMMQQAQQEGQEIARIYDLTAGKYDLVVKAGPSYGTQREMAQAEIVEIIRAFPDSAPILGPMYLRNSDWPGADEAADKLEGGGEQADPQQMRQIMGQAQQMAQELAQLKAQLQDKQTEQQLKAQELQIDQFRAETERMEKTAKAQTDATKAQADVVGAYAKARQPEQPFAVNGLG